VTKQERQVLAKAWFALALILLTIIALLCLASSAPAQSCTVSNYSVTLSGNLRGANGIPTKNSTLTLTPSQLGFIPACGINLPTTNTCATSTDGSVVGIPNPLTPTINTTSAGGSLAGGVYYTVYEWYDAAAHVTLASPETVTTLSITESLVVNPPSSGIPSNAVGMDVFIGTTSGGETLQGQTTGSASYVQSSALTSGASPASTNSTLCQVVANDAVFPTGTGYNVGMVDSNGNQIPNFPMQWQLMGPGTTINLSNGIPYYHGVVNFPAIILAQPANHGTQSISGPLSLGGYGLLNVGQITGAITINSTPYLIATGGELGAQLSAAVTAGYTNIELAPSASYTMTTVANLASGGVGVFIDCKGSTITATYSLGDLIRWDNTAAWTQLHSEYIQPLTGIANCKFTPTSTPNANTTMRVGYVGAISNFVAENISVSYGGAFELVGPSIVGRYTSVHVMDPTTPNVWQFTTGTGASGWFGPNGNQIADPWCEGVTGSIYAGQAETCFEVDGGQVNIADGYLEAFTTGVHVNGGSVTVHHMTANTRAFPGTIFLVDSGTLTIDGINSQMGGDTAGDNMYFMKYNATGFPANPPLGISNIDWNVTSYPGTSTFVLASQPMILNVGGRNGVILTGAQTGIMFATTGSGVFYESTVTGLSVDQGSSAAGIFSSGSGTIFGDSTIAANTFLRMSGFVGLGQGTNIVGNTFVGNPTITYTSSSATALTGNVFDGTPTVGGSSVFCFSNVGYTCALVIPGLIVNGGSQMTGNQGTGALLQHSTGSTTTSDIVSFDSNGNAVDSGYSMASPPAAGYGSTTPEPVFGTSVSAGTAKWTSGSGAPGGSCTVGSLYSNTSAGSTSTILYLCQPANTWNAVTVP
jgi:hypothetical protein